MREEDIERELAETQKAFADGTRQLRLARTKAVLKAREAGWSKYKIAAAMGIKAPSVTSILDSAPDSTD